ncbi:hypothetical protein [Brevundimonas sp.]|uniref:hypothetical protein n=1 Tax=Brevundimonas sp. TaxID=1871086 RepID=UPI0035B4431C
MITRVKTIPIRIETDLHNSFTRYCLDNDIPTLDGGGFTHADDAGVWGAMTYIFPSDTVAARFINAYSSYIEHVSSMTQAEYDAYLG